MAYTVTDYPSKKALRAAVEQGDVPVYQPGPFGPDVRDDSAALIEGPHYPKPHRWYASVTVRGGMIPQGSKVR